MALIPRAIEDELRDILSVSRAAAIIGPRQAGKSTLALRMRDAGAVANYVSLDDDAIRTAAREDPDGFAVSLARPTAIDEIQRAPELMLALKQILDRDRSPGQFLLTGSTDLLSSRAIADSLPGRVEYVNLWPLAQAEVGRARSSVIDALLAGEIPRVNDAPRGRAAVADLVIAGGYPDVRERTPRQRVRYFRSYLRTVLGRDLPDVGEVRVDSSKLEQLLRLLAARTSGLVNYAGLARDLALDDKTVKAHVELLAQLFMLYRLQPWSANLGARQVKTPKLLLSDSGMAGALLGFDSTRYAALDQGVTAGALFETFVTMELVKQATWACAPVELFFYRDTEKREVDVLIESASGEVAGIEVKSAARVDRTDTRGLRLLRDRLGARFAVGVVVYCGERTLPLGERIWAVPVSGLWRGDGTACAKVNAAQVDP